MRLLTVLLAAAALSSAASAQAVPNPCPNAQPVPAALKLPAFIPPGEPVAVEKQLLQYLSTLDYRNLGWCRDKWVRDTGPMIGPVWSIVHPAVHIYYSPEVSEWLINERKGDIPDGAVIIKEQFAPPPAARYRDIPNNALGCSNDWTIMIRDSKSSFDGWFWAEVWNGSKPDNGMNFNNPFQYPNAGYGIACLRCHASAENQHTFVSLNNIEGSPGWPLQFRIDDTWHQKPLPPPPSTCGTGAATLIDLIEAEKPLVAPAKPLVAPAKPLPPAKPGAAKLLSAVRLPSAAEEPIPPALYPQHEQNAALQEDLSAMPRAMLLRAVAPVPPSLQKFPPEPLDDTLAPPKVPAGSPGFVTSSQCMGCHSGLAGAGLGPTMVLAASSTNPINVSPYGEWRWTPMGLAGRDPVFYSQLDSELAALPEPKARQEVVDTCAQCHNAMGKRTFAAEHPGQPYQIADVFNSDPHSGGFHIGGLARDGISCEVCHRMQAPKDPSLPYFLAHQINGVFDLTPPDQLHGPFKDNEITTYPMLQGVNVKPMYDSYIQEPQLCGTCHTIVLPVLDSPQEGKTSVEQNTYVEWLNSDFRSEYGSEGPTPESCQECHMPTGYANARSGMNVAAIQDRIATVQDGTYPAAEHLADPADINVRYRATGFRRHELLGANGFLLQMFLKPVNASLNNEVLGVRLLDYMSSLPTDLQAASDDVVQQAQTITATVAITKWQVESNKLIAEVTVTNKAGHRFPSGVGFRRAFLDFEANVNGKPFFSSGATDAMGRIVDFSGHVLPTESFSGGQYQPHFSQAHPITASSQVQIYEELIQDAQHHFTTSFTRRDYDIKDNRLLPRGWSPHGPSNLTIPEPFLHATLPVGDALCDPVYRAGKGQSIVRYEIPLPAGVSASSLHATVKLYSQSLPPYFLADRYQTKTPATDRLEYLATALGTLKGTDYANWKLLVASANK